MEFINEIRLRGVVGRAEVNTFNGKQVCKFSVVTDYSTVDREGNSAIESTWFNVSAWSGRNTIIDLYSIQKGSWIEVIGRYRIRKYIGADNEERTTSEVLAHTVKLVQKEGERMQAQRDL